MGVDCAVIYGSLPPGAKLGMAAKFNDPDDPCKVLVATDAVGMGLNLNIRRVIFYSMTKLQVRHNQFIIRRALNAFLLPAAEQVYTLALSHHHHPSQRTHFLVSI